MFEDADQLHDVNVHWLELETRKVEGRKLRIFPYSAVAEGAILGMAWSS